MSYVYRSGIGHSTGMRHSRIQTDQVCAYLMLIQHIDQEAGGTTMTSGDYNIIPFLLVGVIILKFVLNFQSIN